ncbi:Hpt domain-containing protein [Sulfurimonas sp. SAG-AH-194-C20]|nr:Hpt domain-containing protein [Sulfurimonas sp. SAG-AH-194-C20]MDF1878173.1 Hpt domain-containing protein [Sulfurimonas sp. SAG-AH-194-C20]
MALTNPDYSNLDYDDMAKNIGLKPKHIPLLLSSYLEEAQPLFASLETAIAKNDYETIKKNAHSLKGSSGNMRFTELYDMAKEMELSAAESNSSFEYAKYLEAISIAVATIKI